MGSRLFKIIFVTVTYVAKIQMCKAMLVIFFYGMFEGKLKDLSVS